MPEREALTIDDILVAFKESEGIYEREMVDAAIERRVEIVPRLIALLQDVIDAPDDYLEKEDRLDHLYALMLLGYFEATEAHDTIVDLFSQPDGLPHELFGEIATDNLPDILLRTCGGALDRIKAMALDRQVDDYCRSSALLALSFAVAKGIAARGDIVAFIGGLFTGNEAEKDSDFWLFAAEIAAELYPEENMAIIEKAFADGLISETIISYDHIQSFMVRGKDETLAQLKTKYDSFAINDIHASMSWWACFQEGMDWTVPSAPTDLFNSPLYPLPEATLKKKPTKEKKKKRKQTQSAKRKNRRR